jgi:hypothetical protein
MREATPNASNTLEQGPANAILDKPSASAEADAASLTLESLASNTEPPKQQRRSNEFWLASTAGTLTPRAASKRFTRSLTSALYWQGWKTVGAVAASLVAIATALVTYQTFGVSSRTLQANTLQQTSDRFGKAIEHLGSDNLDVRLGGIYALDKLAWDTPSEHADVYNVLTAFVRGHAAVGKDTCADSGAPGVVPSSPAPSPLAARTSPGPSSWVRSAHAQTRTFKQ